MNLLEQLSDKFLTGDGCWEWIAHRSPQGYGMVNIGGRPTVAHRVIYELFVGPIPVGQPLDHLCRNTGCVRPDHLEPVTHAENHRRGLDGVLRTHCDKKLHLWIPENIHVHPNGALRCKPCRADYDRRYNRRRGGDNS